MTKVNLEALRNKPLTEIGAVINSFLFPSAPEKLSMKNANVLIDYGCTVHFEMRTDMGGKDHRFIAVFFQGFRYQYEYKTMAAT